MVYNNNNDNNDNNDNNNNNNNILMVPIKLTILYHFMDIIYIYTHAHHFQTHPYSAMTSEESLSDVFWKKKNHPSTG